MKCRSWPLLLLLGALTPCVLADGEALKKLKDLEREFDESTRAPKERYLEFRPKLEAFAAAHAGTAEGLEAKLWVLQNAWWLREENDGSMEDAAARAWDGVIAEYPRSEGLAEVADWYYLFRKKKFAEVLGFLGEPGRPEPVRAAAGLAVAIRTFHDGKEVDARKLFEGVAKDFGKLKKGYATYEALANAYLHRHPRDSLAAGKLAPEITGASPDQKPLKLSDFEGRVIVIDFFGDW
jgi:hypothetical protein